MVSIILGPENWAFIPWFVEIYKTVSSSKLTLFSMTGAFGNCVRWWVISRISVSIAWLLLIMCKHGMHITQDLYTRRKWKEFPNKELCGPLLPICLTKPVDTRQMTRFKNAPLALYRSKQTVIEERHYKDEYTEGIQSFRVLNTEELNSNLNPCRTQEGGREWSSAGFQPVP